MVCMEMSLLTITGFVNQSFNNKEKKFQMKTSGCMGIQ